MFPFTVVGRLAAGPLFDRLSVAGMCLWHLVVAASVALTFFVGRLPALLLFAVARGIAHGGPASEAGSAGEPLLPRASPRSLDASAARDLDGRRGHRARHACADCRRHGIATASRC